MISRVFFFASNEPGACEARALGNIKTPHASLLAVRWINVSQEACVYTHASGEYRESHKKTSVRGFLMT